MTHYVTITLFLFYHHYIHIILLRWVYSYTGTYKYTYTFSIIIIILRVGNYTAHTHIHRNNEKRQLRVVSVDRCVVYRVSQNMIDKLCVLVIHTCQNEGFFLFIKRHWPPETRLPALFSSSQSIICNVYLLNSHFRAVDLSFLKLFLRKQLFFSVGCTIYT